jgi:branched-chain amino acid aminotransferase
MAEIVYINGSLVPRSEARISVSDHGFLYGYGLFETMRAYNGTVFLLERHLDRLLKSAKSIGINLSGIDLSQACKDTVEANGLQSARIRLTVSNGDSDALPWKETDSRPTLVITARNYQPFPPEVYEKGFRVGVSSYQRSRHSSLSGIKATNYLVNVLARHEATLNGLDEALLLNEDGYLTEGSTSNIFFVKSSGLVTPPLDSGILPGITRNLVIEIAGKLGIKVTEENISLTDLSQFQEAFLTASTMEIMPLIMIKGQDREENIIGSGEPGATMKRLMAAYKERVKQETGV